MPLDLADHPAQPVPAFGLVTEINDLDLDAVSPKNPVLLQDFQRNFLWANSKALQLAGINAETTDLMGATVHKDPADGHPTGFLEVPRFIDFVLIGSLLPPMTYTQRREGILACLKALNAYGITSVVEPGLGVGIGYFCRGVHETENLRVLSDLHREGRLDMRITALLFSQDFLAPGVASLEGLKRYLDYVGTNTGFGDEWLRIGGLKMLVDFAHFNKTAWMYEDYVGGGNGMLLVKGETDDERCRELTEMIKYGHSKRWQIGIHTIGDRTTDACVDGFIEAQQEDPWDDARHYLIHVNFVRPETMKRMAEYKIGASIQSAWKWWYMYSDLDEPAVGPERNARSIPMRSLLDAGVRVANGSDAPETDPDWKIGVMAAVTRRSKLTGQVGGPEECVTVEEAIRSYTLDAAYLDHQDQVKGSIETGKYADFCILGDDILSVDPEAIPDIPVLMTIVGGRIVYDADSGEINLTTGSGK